MSVTSFDQAWRELERYFHVVLPDALGNPALGFRDGTWFRLGLGGRPQPLMARSAILEYPDQAGSVVQICCWWMRENHTHPRALDLATELAITVAEMARGTARVRQPLPAREIAGRELGGSSVFDGPVQFLGDPLTGPAVPVQRGNGQVPALGPGAPDQGRASGGWTGGWPTRAPQNEHADNPSGSNAWTGQHGLPAPSAPSAGNPQPPRTTTYGHPTGTYPAAQRPAGGQFPAAQPQATGGYRRPTPEASGFWPVDQIPQAAAPTQAIPVVDPRRPATSGTGDHGLPGRSGQPVRRTSGTGGHHPPSRSGRPAGVGPTTEGYPWRDISR